MNKLKEKSLSGYDLIKEIYNSTGSWKPSFGSMYPLLKELYTNKLVSIKIVNRKKVYTLTAQGVKVLNEAVDASQDTIRMLLKEFKVMEAICSPQERNHTQAIIKEIKQNSIPFSNLTEEISKLQRTLFKLHSEGKIKTHEDEIKKILNSTLIKLNNL